MASRPERSHSERGSAMVEFALIAPMLLLILFGIIGIGILMNAKIVVAGAAREAARAYSVAIRSPANNPGGLSPEAEAKKNAKQALSDGGLSAQNVVEIRFDPVGTDYVRATVTYRQPAMVPFLHYLDPNSAGPYITLESQAVFRKEGK